MGDSMKNFSISINTNPSGLWMLDEERILHFVLTPAMDYAKRNALHITFFSWEDTVIKFFLRGAPDLLAKFLAEFEDYMAYALNELEPYYSCDAFGKTSCNFESLPRRTQSPKLLASENIFVICGSSPDAVSHEAAPP